MAYRPDYNSFLIENNSQSSVRSLIFEADGSKILRRKELRHSDRENGEIESLTTNSGLKDRNCHDETENAIVTRHQKFFVDADSEGLDYEHPRARNTSSVSYVDPAHAREKVDPLRRCLILKDEMQRKVNDETNHLNLKKSNAGPAYIPPPKLRALQQDSVEDSEEAKQRASWERLKKKINGSINKIDQNNFKTVIPEFFEENLIRGRALFCKSIMKAQAAALPYTSLYACVVGVVNTKLPQVGELLLNRLVIQFRKAYKRNDKPDCVSAAKFIGHLTNLRVAHEILVLQILSLLIENATDSSVEIAVSLLREVGQFLSEYSLRASNAIFDKLRILLMDGKMETRTLYMIEVLFQNRKDEFRQNPIIPPHLDVIEDDDQITHFISLDDQLDARDSLENFRFDPGLETKEQEYHAIRDEILGPEGSDMEESGGSDEEIGDAQQKNLGIEDRTEINLANLRKTIYLTIMSSIDFEECSHKLLKLKIPESKERELCRMIIECCSQEKAYSKFYGLISERLCKLRRNFSACFIGYFHEYYDTIHRYELNKIRNIAQIFSHLLSSNSISYAVLSHINLTEEDTTSSSRIFIKYLFQNLAQSVGIKNLTDILYDRLVLDNLFPAKNQSSLRFSINFFTSIGLGGITEGARKILKTITLSEK